LDPALHFAASNKAGYFNTRFFAVCMPFCIVLKQIKQCNTAQRYGEHNVCMLRMQKPSTFLHFQFEGYSPERHHLLTRNGADRGRLATKVAALTASGFSQREISQQLGIGLATVNRLLHLVDYECAHKEKCGDMRMPECADEEDAARISAGDEVIRAIRAPENTGAENTCSAGSPLYTYILLDDEEGEPPGNMPPSPMPVGDIERGALQVKSTSVHITEASEIDALITPGLLKYLRRMKQKN